MKPNDPNDPKRKHGPARAPLALLAVGLLVLTAACLWRVFGAGELGARLQTETGSTAALQGFALTGTVQGRYHSARFTMRDGTVQNTVSPDTQTLAEIPETYTTFSGDSAAAPEAVPALNAEATVSSPYVLTASGTATQFWNMVTIYLPGQYRRLRLRVSTMETAEPRSVICYPASNIGWVMDTSDTEENELLWDGTVAVAQGTPVWNGSYTFCLGLPGERPAGLYRVDSALTYEEAEALPPDGKILGCSVTYPSTEYGAATLLYRLDDAVQIYACARAGDGMALVWRDAGNRLLVDLVSADGRRTDRAVLLEQLTGSEAALRLISVTPLPRQSETDAAFVLYGDATETGEKHSETLIVMRAGASGLERLTVQTTPWPQGDWQSPFGTVEAAFYNDAGDAVLVVREAQGEATLRGGAGSLSYTAGHRLSVYTDLAADPVYTGILSAGEQYGWADQLQSAAGLYGLIDKSPASAYAYFPCVYDEKTADEQQKGA